MNSPFGARPSARRGTFLAVVVGGHVLVGGALWTVKSLAPAASEAPLIVDLLPPRPIVPKEIALPKPVAKPLPTVPQTPQKRELPIEATQSAVAAPTAPAAVIAPPAPPAPVSEAMTAARFDVDTLHNPAPPYPAISRRRGEEGKVVLRVVVSSQGTAEAIEVRSSSGSSRLDEAAMATVKTWRFVPAKRGETPVQSAVLVPIIFRLEM